jgi:excisionase family DNA binding protein
VNFADAIRQAAHHAGELVSHSEPQEAPEVKAVENLEWNVETQQPPLHVGAIDAVTAEPVRAPDPPHMPVAYGSVVRLELFLSPEQLNGLFRAVAANQHSVMTLREAASYLRLSPVRLEELANEGEIPGISIDGRWRFTRSAIDDWMNLQAVRKENAS